MIRMAAGAKVHFRPGGGGKLPIVSRGTRRGVVSNDRDARRAGVHKWPRYQRKYNIDNPPPGARTSIAPELSHFVHCDDIGEHGPLLYAQVSLTMDISPHV